MEAGVLGCCCSLATVWSPQQVSEMLIRKPLPRECNPEMAVLLPWDWGGHEEDKGVRSPPHITHHWSLQTNMPKGCWRAMGLSSLHEPCCENLKSTFLITDHFNRDGRAQHDSANTSVGIIIISVCVPAPAPCSNLLPEAALQEGVWASLLAPSHLEQTPAC